MENATPLDIEKLEKKHKRPICQGECQKPMPIYENVPNGFESPEIWKLEEASVNGIAGYKVKKKVLCADCYLLAFARRYGPEVELPKMPRIIE